MLAKDEDDRATPGHCTLHDLHESCGIARLYHPVLAGATSSYGTTSEQPVSWVSPIGTHGESVGNWRQTV